MCASGNCDVNTDTCKKAECSMHKDCKDTEFCANKIRCLKKYENGYQCNLNDECVSGVCDEGKCMESTTSPTEPTKPPTTSPTEPSEPVPESTICTNFSECTSFTLNLFPQNQAHHEPLL